MLFGTYLQQNLLKVFNKRDTNRTPLVFVKSTTLPIVPQPLLQWPLCKIVLQVSKANWLIILTSKQPTKHYLAFVAIKLFTILLSNLTQIKVNRYGRLYRWKPPSEGPAKYKSFIFQLRVLALTYKLQFSECMTVIRTGGRGRSDRGRIKNEMERKREIKDNAKTKERNGREREEVRSE